MKAIVLVKTGHPDTAFEIQERAIPNPKPDEVLIKTEGFGINYADTMARKGLYPDAPPLPSVLGYEVVGRVEGVGNQVDKNLIGKRVVGFTRFGGYAQYAVTNELAVAEIPEDMPMGEATALATQYATAYFAIYETVRLHPGDKVLVHSAAGGVGIALTQMAKLQGCEVFGTAGSDAKIEFIKKNGVDHAINYSKQDYQAEMKKILGKGRIDVAFNAVGGKSFKKDWKLIGSGGRVVLYGMAARRGGHLAGLKILWQMGLIIPATLIMSSKSLIGVNMLRMADNQPLVIQRCIKEIIKLAADGKLKPYCGKTFPAEQIGDAQLYLENRQSIGKVAVSWK
ncbi:zinc-binding dehydrogenase [Flammeovirgaceae bacterium SG7u.111]|nr:zinc-binding dehydrogenase [Flammeovirgaceae bacterium SG7u.132]WPO38284.1 zinc-binding dehydrogenase [Flammeovirgaceae bacterium SG7u.111]